MQILCQNNKMKLEQVPADLVEHKQWVAWTGEKKSNGKMTKIPINPNTGKPAKANDPDTWGSFEEALSCREREGLQGVGFMFAASDPFVGIDLDNCFDPETLDPTPEAVEAIRRFASYTEISPSGKGLHIIVKGHLPESGRRKGCIEMYDSKRFFTITGGILVGCTNEIAERQQEIDEFYQEHFVESDPPKVIPLRGRSPDQADEDILRKAMNAGNGDKFSRLWHGDHSDYPSQSEADMALCGQLAYWTEGDREGVDRLFRQSGLFRGKWDKRRGSRTYGQQTIDKALEGMSGLGGHHKEVAPQPKPSARVEQPEFHLTDLGNAERLVHHHGEDIRYCHAWKKWLIWDGRRWAPDDSDRIMRLAKEVIRFIYSEAERASDSSERRDIARHAMRSESDRSINAMVDLARSEVPISPEELDQDPWLFNCANGTIDLRTGRLRGHRREDFITKLVPVAYDPEAEHPLWDRFLDRILDGNQDLVDFMQRAVGYALTGSTIEQCLFILHGAGANGKTTFLQTVGEILADYAMQTPTETLLVKGKGAISNDVARLKGARFVTASEAEAEQRLAENLIKQMTGGDTLSARFLHQEYFDFKPTHKLFLGTNHKPVIKGTDHAIWRRIRLIPFEVTIPENERDPGLLDKLLGEAEGILAWAVEGCLRWRAGGLAAPAAVKRATDGYRSEMDVIARFIEDCCEQRSDSHTAGKDLFRAFEQWCSQNGEDPVTRNLFTRRLKESGFGDARTGPDRIRCIKGLVLVSG